MLIDEFGDVAFPLFTNALNKGGGANARFILAQQSLADAEAAMGPAQARRVLDNLNTKIWCRLADDRTAAEATEGLGLCTVRLPETGVGLSYGGVGGLSGSAQRRLVARETPLIRPAWLTALPRGECCADERRGVEAARAAAHAGATAHPGGVGAPSLVAWPRPGYRPRYAAVMAGRQCPSSALMSTRASSSASRWAGVNCPQDGPPMAGHGNPASSRKRSCA